MKPAIRTELTRKVRLALPAMSGEPIRLPADAEEWTNNWVGGPTTDSLVPNVELNVTIANAVDERTGYIEDITVVDRLVRGVVLDWMHEQISDPRRMPISAWGWLREFVTRLIHRYPNPDTIARIELRVSPRWSFAIEQEHPSVIIVTRQYEFSAAHRLHSTALSPEENEALYGKCNRIHGHGHNYLLDVCLSGEMDERTSTLLPAATIDRIVKERVISRLDHCYLNREVDPFRELNPTVENIAETIWNWLEGRFEPARLARIRVYETAKTWVDVVGGLPVIE